MRALIPFLRVPPSWPNNLQRPQLWISSLWGGTRFQWMNFGGAQTLQLALISRAHWTKCLFEAFRARHPPHWTQMANPKPMLLCPLAPLFSTFTPCFSQTVYLLLATFWCSLMFRPQPASTFIHARFLWVFSQFHLSNYHQFASDCRIFISNSHPSFWSSEQFLFLPLYRTGATQSAVSGPQQWSVNCWYCSRIGWV